MKRLLLILILTLSFQTLSKADDIKDFEIEGMSIGDSLLDFFSKSEIKKNSKNYYKNKKYTPVENTNYPFFKDYYAVDVAYKSKDKKFIIHSLAGIIDYKKKDMKKCYVQMNEIIEDITMMFPNFEIGKTNTFKHKADKTKKSIFKTKSFWSDEGRISVTCYDYSLELGWDDHLSVAIQTNGFNTFLLTAYE